MKKPQVRVTVSLVPDGEILQTAIVSRERDRADDNSSKLAIDIIGLMRIYYTVQGED